MRGQARAALKQFIRKRGKYAKEQVHKETIGES